MSVTLATALTVRRFRQELRAAAQNAMRADTVERWRIAFREFVTALEKWTRTRIDGIVAWLQVRLLLVEGGTFELSER